MLSDVSKEQIPGEKADDLVDLLKAGMYEDFLELYRRSAKDVKDGAVILAEMVNSRMRLAFPDCETTLVVSQQMQDKHLVVIQDGSRFFGDSWTVTRNMFVV
jgi:hypothetical protein